MGPVTDVPRQRLARVALLIAAFTLTSVASAQEVSGSISGTIIDPSGASVKGAIVTLTNADRGHVERSLTTNAAGFYTANSLPLGSYTIRIEDAGFKSESITGLVLHVQDSITINRSLQVGSSDQQIAVTADALQLNLEDATSASLINGTQMRELILNTRNYEQLLGLQPGVAYTGTSDQIYLGPTNPLGGANTVAFSVNGQRTSANSWTIDGADNVDRGSNLTLLSFPSVDAIAEFKTLRGTYSAEYGRAAAGQVSLVTRSGTNQIHGSAYEFFRNNEFNANAYFNKLTAIPTPLAPLHYHDFGYTAGGPVVIPKIYNGHDRTFFFFSQEFRRVITYSPVTLNVPSASERAGIFPFAVCANLNSSASKCNDAGVTQLPAARLSPLAQAYLKDIYSLDGSKVPLPNPGAGQDPHAFTYNGRNVYNDTQEVVRIDQAFGQKLNVFYRLVHDSIPTQEPYGYGSGSTGFPGVQITNTRSPGTQHLGHATYVQSATLLADVGYAYSSGAIISTPVGSGLSTNSPDIKPTLPYTSTLGVVPNLSFTGFTGINNAGIYNDYNRNHNIFGNVTKLVKSHTFIFGVTYNRYQKTENLTGGNAGSFTFTAAVGSLPTSSQAGANVDNIFEQSFANFLLGTATGGFVQNSSSRTPNLHANQIEVYAQDNYKATHRLTLNLGVRYSYFQQPTDSNNQLSNFNPATYIAANAPTIDSNGNLCTAAPCANTAHLNTGVPNPTYDPLNGIVLGTPGNFGHASPYGAQVGTADKANFAPRIGLAFDLFGDGKTAFRMGYGIAYDASLYGDYEQNVFYNPPYVGTATYTLTTLDNPTGGTVSTAAPALPTIYSESPQFHTPYSQQYSVDIQQQLTPTLVLDMGYFGDHDTHLLGYIDINALRPGAAAAAGILPAGGFINSTQTKLANQLRPYKGYGGMYGDETIFSSNYNSLQISVKKRFKGNSLIDGNYTWSNSMTNSPADRSGAPQNIYNIAGEYGRSILSRTNIATIDGVWELPWFHDQKGIVGHVLGGWETSGILAANSGLPFSVSTSAGGLINGVVNADVAGLGIIGASPAGLRPDQISSPQNGTGLKTRLKWFNTAAFASPSATLGQPGNAKRGTIIGPGFVRLDTGIFRNFRITERAAFQLRGEAFNTLNHTNFSSIAVAATTPSTFGQVTAARENRILQFGGKLSF
ncbi:carboxypeptidase regulatory-like domain-containing protein [Granulicella arctica]|uniref:carboxypeptidase regulatory-like domain-containing protein n=1 Tax=Granulicella arctica TaxID=940613 RepID=UPI0021DF8426|nr:carboxypeptidase regulatory-like domain-containing protein [Granulicella arctica]